MVNGIINVYKEKGFTSFDVVAKMRGIFHQKKIGHTGTLDPEAEGVLPVCLGKATKVCDLLTDKDKVYEAVLLLGQETDTQDTTGEIINSSEVTCSEDEVREVIMSFVGESKQIPPMYSALKVNGQKLCDLARKGITVERKARDITIFSIEISEIKLPEVTMRVHCSKGTYIRTLCNDIGIKLGCFGCMKKLTRTKVAMFEIEDSLKLCELEELVSNQTDMKKYVHSIDSVFENLPRVVAKPEATRILDNGNKVSSELIENMTDDFKKESVRMYDENERFIGIFSYIEREDNFKPVKMFKE